MEEYVEIKLKLRKDTYEDILQITGYENYDNRINEDDVNLPVDYTIDDFITGSINTHISEIKKIAKLSDYGKLNSHAPLKNKFKERLDELGMTQRQLSKIIGIHQSGLSTFLNNHQQPSLDTFLKIWVGLGCPSISEILYRDE